MIERFGSALNIVMLQVTPCLVAADLGRSCIISPLEFATASMMGRGSRNVPEVSWNWALFGSNLAEA